MLSGWKERARQLKRETYALYLALRDPRVPWYARALAAAIVAYAFSPIDLIPDFVPVLGYLDDLVIIPLATSLVLRLVPKAVMDECRARAEAVMAEGKPISRVGAAVVLGIWVLLAALAVVFVVGVVRG